MFKTQFSAQILFLSNKFLNSYSYLKPNQDLQFLMKQFTTTLCGVSIKHGYSVITRLYLYPSDFMYCFHTSHFIKGIGANPSDQSFSEN